MNAVKTPPSTLTVGGNCAWFGVADGAMLVGDAVGVGDAVAHA